MELLAGTSGFSYDEWTGPFYPKGLKSGERLAYYSERFPTVELNNTFYRMPRTSVLEGWAAAVPETFRFALKASRRITHQRKLEGVEETLEYLWRGAERLGPLLGPILFQLPPVMRADLERLKRFLGLLPQPMQAAFEFRHPSWADESVVQALRDHGASLVFCDEEGLDPEDWVPTTNWGYLRLRRADYSADELRGWQERIRSQPWERAFCFFKHEEGGAGPRLVEVFLNL